MQKVKLKPYLVTDGGRTSYIPDLGEKKTKGF